MGNLNVVFQDYISLTSVIINESPSGFLQKIIYLNTCFSFFCGHFAEYSSCQVNRKVKVMELKLLLTTLENQGLRETVCNLQIYYNINRITKKSQSLGFSMVHLLERGLGL